MTAALIPDQMLTPGEVAMMFRVDVKTVTRWANDGKLTTIRTLGGHRRFYEREVRDLVSGSREGMCPDCHYKFGTPGHKVSCGGTS